MRLLSIILFLWFASVLKLYALKPNFRYLNAETGLGSNITRWTYQDKNGFIWISTKVGLSRFDGYEVNNYYTNSSEPGALKDIIIGYPIEPDENQILFSSAKGIIRYDKKLDNFKYFAGNNNELYKTKQLTRDKNGYMWVAKDNIGFLKLDYANDSIKTIRLIDGSTEGYKMRKTQIIHTDTNGDVWLFSLGFIAVVRHDNNKIEYIKNWGTSFESIHEYSPNNLILVDAAGYFYHLNPQTLKITQYSKNYSLERDIRHNFKCKFLDKNQVLGISRKGGLFYLDHNFNKKEVKLKNNYQKQPDFENSLSSNNIRHVFIDRTGVAWLSTDGGGVCYFNLKPKKFKHIKYGKNNGGLSDSYISALYEDRHNNLWVSVWQSDVNVLPAQNNYSDFKYLKNEDIVSDKYKGYESVTAFAELKKGNEYVMLLGSANYRYLKNYSGLNFNNPDIVNFGSDIIERKTRIHDYLLEDDKYLWICRSEEGLERHTLDENANITDSYFFDKFPTYAKLYQQAGHCHNIHKDKNDVIWILHESLVFMVKDSLRTPLLKPIKLTGRMQMMHEDKKGNLWFVTKGNGLIKVRFDKKGKIKSRVDYNVNNGFADDNLYSICEDKQGIFWIAANTGLIKFNPDSEKFQVYGTGDGISGKSFVERCCVYRQNGEMIFGTTNGLYVFRPENITNKSPKPETVVTGFYIFDKKVKVGDEPFGKKLLPQHITVTSKIEVPHKANVLAFEFAALHFATPYSNSFHYKLEGFDKNWRSTNATQRKVTYTNLREGKYTFLVKSANKDGIWDNTPAQIQLIVNPPFFRTLPAYILYFIIILSTFLILRRYYLNRLKMKHALEMERFEKMKIEELAQMKMRFFTNVSHEFRTPLSLIKASIDSISADSKIASSANDIDFLSITKRNIAILLRLVNQLIDVRRFDQGKMKIEKKETEVVSFIHETASSFLPIAEKKGISFYYQSACPKVYADIDQDQIEKVIYNLLSNAFKHTLKEGSVKIDVFEKDNNIEIIVKDTGKGIPLEHQKSIFKRFYQGEKVQSENLGSSGIGLSLTKEFVEMHKGTISFQSKVSEGTTFIVNLPKLSQTLTHSVEKPNEKIILLERNLTLSNSQTSSKEEPNLDPIKKTILVVEDNMELRNFLVNRLGNTYNIIEAENGAIGLKKCLSPGATEIDLVISDVMMPEKNGYQLCQEIKNTTETSHIPVILLTAKTADEHKLEGFNKGADAYIEKPFNYELLKAQVKSILDSKLKLREYFRQIQIDKNEAIAPEDDYALNTELSETNSTKQENSHNQPSHLANDYDAELMKRIKDTIKDKIHDPLFSVEILASECAISESTLRRKVKALTGESPSILIRRYKIRLAGDLIKKEEHTVYEAMYEAGFSNYANFSKLFANEFRLTPGEFRKQHNSTLET